MRQQQGLASQHMWRGTLAANITTCQRSHLLHHPPDVEVVGESLRGTEAAVCAVCAALAAAPNSCKATSSCSYSHISLHLLQMACPLGDVQ